MPAPSRLDRLFGAMRDRGNARALIEGGTEHSYRDLLAAIDLADARIEALGIAAGDVVGLQSDFSLRAIALALALFRRRCIVALLSPSAKDVTPLLADAEARWLADLHTEEPRFTAVSGEGSHPLLGELRQSGAAGFIIFSSGSTGAPKAILHDLGRFLSAYEKARKPFATLAFLLFDHIAGLDTLFYTLHAGGSLVLVADRSPATVCAAIERWSAEVLPASPSFLKLLCLSAAGADFDLGSLRIVTYGSEPMDAATLSRLAEMLPHASLRQKYGASEFGAPRARTRDGDGLWLRLDGGDVGVRIEDGLLWLHAPTTMLGYLNAEPPAMRDGWICTGDSVETDGPWLRIIGRASEMINVGGEKVYPSEVEAAIKELDSVAEVAVAGEAHPILGQIVTAMIRPAATDADRAGLRTSIRSHCLKRLDRFKVPAKIGFTSGALINERQKTIRSAVASES